MATESLVALQEHRTAPSSTAIPVSASRFPWRQRSRRIVLAVVLAIVAGEVFAGEWRFFLARDPQLLFEVRDDIRQFDDLSQWPPARGTFQNEGFRPCVLGSWADSGWCLPAGQAGKLRYTLPVVPGSRSLLIRLFFFHKNPQATHRLLVSREGESSPRRVFENVHFIDARLDVSSVLSGDRERVVLTFEGNNPTETPDVLLQQVEVRWFADSLPVPPSLLRVTCAILALGLCLLPFVHWRTLIPVWSVLTLGFVLRYTALLRVLWLPLDWDAVGYQQLARKMTLFTDTGFYSAQFSMREPLFLLIAKTGFALLGDSETHLRLVSLVGSLIAILLSYRAAKRFGRGWALAGALCMAVSLPLVRESVRGLRLELELVLMLLFVDNAFLTVFRSAWRKAVVLGCLAGLLALTRVTYLVTLLPLLCYAVWRQHPRQGWVLGVSLLIALGLQLPHRISMYRHHGDAFWEVREYARYNAEVELSKQQHPMQIRRPDPHMGSITLSGYLFGLHDVNDLVFGTIRGLGRIVRHMELIAFHEGIEHLTGLKLAIVDSGFQFMGLFGFLLSVFRAETRWIPFTFFSLMIPIAFLYDRGVIELWRNTYQAFPFMVLGCLVTCHVGSCLFRSGRRSSGVGAMSS